LDELKHLRIGQEPIIQWERRGEEPVSSAAAPYAANEPTDDLAGLEVAPVGSEPSSPPDVYISYAWGDETPSGMIRKEIVDGVEMCAKEERWKVHRDRDEIAPGNSIKEFMSRIQHGGLVVVILSDRYLRSLRCMAELHGIYVDSKCNQEEFRKRIVPVVLDDAQIGEPKELAKVSKFWKSEHERVRRDAAALGPDAYGDYWLMKKLELASPEILHYISDIKCAWGNIGIRANNYEAVREILKSRRKRPGTPSGFSGL
jgi:hypothetical protein